MILVGLTGGIGSGKSTVARLLEDRGAIVIDADAIVRELQQPGTDVYRRIAERFGPGAVTADGTLDRAAIAEQVFRDDDARAALNAITHPEVMKAIADRLDDLATSDAVVVLDVPLLVEVGGGEGLDVVVVVEAAEEIRIRRLVDSRGMSAEDVRMRMSVQASDDQRHALADVVIRNDGSRASLDEQVEALWQTIEEKAAL